MLVHRLFAMFAVLLLGTTLFGNAEAYPTTARRGVATVTGLYSPLTLDLTLVESYTAPSMTLYTSQLDIFTVFEEGPIGTRLRLTAVYSGTYTGEGYSVPEPTGFAGYWLYSLDVTDFSNPMIVDPITINTTDPLNVFLTSNAVGNLFGTFTYLGGGDIGPLAGYPEDTPLQNDLFQFYTTVIGQVLRVNASNPAGDDFTLVLPKPLAHLGPFLGTDTSNFNLLDDDRFNPECRNDSGEVVPCGGARLSATASAVPEPASLALVGVALAGLALVRRRRLPA